MSDFHFEEMFQLGADETPYRKLTSDHVSTAEFEGQRILKVEAEALTELAAQAMRDVSHLFRPEHLAQLRAILDDPEASANDRFVVKQLLENAAVASEMVLPSCQDTGTAIVMGKKGQNVWTGCDDEEAISRGIHRTLLAGEPRQPQRRRPGLCNRILGGDFRPILLARGCPRTCS